MGIITAASHNVEEMFGFPYEKSLGNPSTTLCQISCRANMIPS